MSPKPQINAPGLGGKEERWLLVRNPENPTSFVVGIGCETTGVIQRMIKFQSSLIPHWDDWLDVQNVLGAISWLDVEVGVVLDRNADQIHDRFCVGFCSFFVSFAFARPCAYIDGARKKTAADDRKSPLQ
jgi:hypothetical protein